MAGLVDLASRRLAGFAVGEHHDAPVAAGALRMAAAIKGRRREGALFHWDRSSPPRCWVCSALGVVQSMVRVGSCFDNAGVESWHSTLERWA